MTDTQKELALLQLKRLVKDFEHGETPVIVSHWLLMYAVALIEKQSENILMLNDLYTSAKRGQLNLCNEIGILKKRIRAIDPEREP